MGVYSWNVQCGARNRGRGDPIPVDGIIPIPGGLVLCTEQGVRILELSGGEVKAVSGIREEHGLVDDYVVSGVFNEKTGLLYVGGNKGISAVDIKTREVMWTVSKRQGLLDNELSWNNGLFSSQNGTYVSRDAQRHCDL